MNEYTVFIDETKYDNSQAFCAILIDHNKLDDYREKIKEQRLILIDDPAYSAPYTGEKNQKSLKKSFHATEMQPDTRFVFFNIIRYFEYEAFIYVYDDYSSVENIRNEFLRNLYKFLQQRHKESKIKFIWEKDKSQKISYPAEIPIIELAKEEDDLIAISDFVLFIFSRGYYKNYTSGNEYQMKQDKIFYELIKEKLRFVKLSKEPQPYTHSNPLELWT